MLRVVTDEKTARSMIDDRRAQTASRADGGGRATLEDLYAQIQAGQTKELRIIIKADQDVEYTDDQPEPSPSGEVEEEQASLGDREVIVLEDGDQALQCVDRTDEDEHRPGEGIPT